MTTTRQVSKAATEQAKSIVQSIIKESDQGSTARKKTKTKTPPKSAWIRAYEQDMKDPSTNYGRGASREYDYFESSLMAHYVDDRERFFELVEQNPEVCAIIYPDQTGKIQVIHHLTPAVHGQVIIVGVDGLGSLSEVKIVNISSLSERVDLGVIDKEQMTPSYDDFLNNDIKAVPFGDQESSDQEGDKLEDFLSTCPVGYMIHPVWLNLIHGAIGRDPVEVASTLRKELTEAFEEGREGFNDYEKIGDYFQEAHLLFVYLWACHHGIVTVKQAGLLKSSGSQAFRDIQNPILQKIIRRNLNNKQVHYLEETSESAKTKTPRNSGSNKSNTQVAKRTKRIDPSPSPPPSESPSPSPKPNDRKRNRSERSRRKESRSPSERRQRRSEDYHHHRRGSSADGSRRGRRSRSHSGGRSTSRSRSRSRRDCSSSGRISEY